MSETFNLCLLPCDVKGDLTRVIVLSAIVQPGKRESDRERKNKIKSVILNW